MGKNIIKLCTSVCVCLCVSVCVCVFVSEQGNKIIVKLFLYCLKRGQLCVVCICIYTLTILQFLLAILTQIPDRKCTELQRVKNKDFNSLRCLELINYHLTKWK